MNKGVVSACCKGSIEVISVNNIAEQLVCKQCHNPCEIYQDGKTSASMELMHEPHCHFSNRSGSKTCSCRLMELYLKRPSLQDWTPRQEFASRAMVAYITDALRNRGIVDCKEVASFSFEMADVMLREGSK